MTDLATSDAAFTTQRALLTHIKQQLTAIHRALRALNGQREALYSEEQKLAREEHRAELALAALERRVKQLAEAQTPDVLDRIAQRFINADRLDEAVELLERKLRG